MMEQPLKGIRVLDLTQALSGPFATMVMADLGAEVIKIERPAGDLTRNTPPHYIEGTSLYFLANNRTKKSVVINLKKDAGRQIFLDLVSKADIVIDNFSAGVVEKLQIDHSSLSKINKRIISCSITGFGVRGDQEGRKAVDLVVQAAAGAMSITGNPNSAPARAGVPTADLSAGLFATIGVLSALQKRSSTGKGSRVETSLFHAQLNLLNYVASYALYSKTSPPPMGSGHLGTVPSQAFPTADGWMAVDAGFDRHFLALCEVIGWKELAEDARFRTRADRATNRDVLIPLISNRLKTRTSDTWARALALKGVPCSPVNDVLTALQLNDSDLHNSIRPIDFGGSTFAALGTPIWFDGETEHPVAEPPLLGEHTTEVLTQLLGYDAQRMLQLSQEGAIPVVPAVASNPSSASMVDRQDEARASNPTRSEEAKHPQVGETV